MVIDLRRTAIKVRLRALFMAIILTVIIVLIYTTKLFRQPIFGLTKNNYALIFLGIYLIVSLYYYLLDLNYFYYDDEKSKLIFKYYSLRPLSQGNKTIEIPYTQFFRFEITNSFFGIRKNLVLFQKMKMGIAKYPPISISSWSEEEINDLKRSLLKYSVKNK